MLNTFFDKFIFTNGLRYKHNNFFLLRIPFLIIPRELLTGLIEKDDRSFNTDLYYHVKRATTDSLTKQFELDFGLHRKKAVHLAEEFFTASGWGLINNVDLNEETQRAIVVVSNSPFADALRGKVKQPACHFLRGVFAGIFGNAFKEDVECVEKECAALGANDCKFVVQKPGEIDFAKEATRQQLKVAI